MAELSTRCGTSSEADTTAMRETLQAQQRLLQKLYAELDQEREASASAASEALSMILRLQGEKAAVEMEACQYKRLAEEKIFHAEESIEVFEDLIYHKEMEIASLEFQVQAYKCKLLSLGGSADSVPAEGQREIEGPGLERKSGSFSSYWKQLRDLDEQVKEIEIARCDDLGGASSSGRESKPCSSPSDDEESSELAKPIQDIFEVPKLNMEESRVVSQCEKSEKSDKIKRVLVGRDLFRPIGLECNAALVDSKAEFKELRERVERLEGERSGTSREASNFGEEERKLLVEIQGRLNAIQDEIRGWKEERAPPKKDDQQVHCLKEALLHFWS